MKASAGLILSPAVFLSILFGVSLAIFFPDILFSDSLRVVYPERPHTLDPHAYPPDPEAYPILLNSYERLFDLSSDSNNLESGNSLARTYRVSDDGLSYTIILKEGESFADGTPVTPEAVLFSFDRLMASDAGRAFFPYLKYMEIKGPHTFTLTLSKPFPAFAASLTLPQASIISPLLSSYDPDYLKEHSLGSGNYTVESFEEDRITLSRRLDLNASASPDRVEIYYEPDPNRRIAAFMEREAHMAVLSPPILDKAPPGSLVKIFPSFTTRFLAFNCETNYLKKKEAREALTLLARHVFSYKNVLPGGILPRGFSGAPASPPGEARATGSKGPSPFLNLEERAADILRKTGYPNVPLRLVYPDGDSDAYKDAKAISDKFSTLKVPVIITPLKGSAGKGIMERGDYDMFLGERHPEIPASEMWLGKFLDSRAGIMSNPARFKDPKADAQIDRFDSSLIRPEREAKIKSLALLASDLNPYVLLYQKEKTLLVERRLDDIKPHPMWPTSFPFREVNLNPYRAGLPPAAGVAPPAPPAAEPVREDFDETVFEFYE
jgi:peptide/nickel transport system substrate-binding protein